MRYRHHIASLTLTLGITFTTIVPAQSLCAPIHDAVERKDLVAIVSILKNDPAAVNTQTEGGSSPLHLAVGMKDQELVALLIEKGANVNLKTGEGYTPLHWAAFFNAGGVARQLIVAGADTDAETNAGVKPLQLALSENAQDVAEALLNKTKAAYTEPALDDRFKEGERARATGDLETAYKILTELLQKDPQNQKVNFAYGMTCMAMKDYPRARLAFERILMVNPMNDRARLELARSQAAGKQFEKARQNLKEVLGHDLKPAVRENVERYLKDVERYSKRHTFSGRLDIGAIDDSNVNVGPDSEIIDIAPIIYGSLTVDELTLSKGSLPSASRGQFASLALSGSYDVGSQGSWLAFGDVMLYNNMLDKAEALESSYFMVAAGGARLNEGCLLRCPVRFSHIESGGEPLVDMVGIAPVYRTVRLDGRVAFTTSGALEKRDYAELDDRDGIFVSLGEAVKMVAKDGKSSISMGLTASHDGTSAGIYEYTGLTWSLTADQLLPMKFVVYGKVQSSKSSYAEKESLSPEQREDSQRQFMVGIRRSLGGHMGLDFNYQDTRNTSTFGLYQYDREVTTASFYYAF